MFASCEGFPSRLVEDSRGELTGKTNRLLIKFLQGDSYCLSASLLDRNVLKLSQELLRKMGSGGPKKCYLPWWKKQQKKELKTEKRANNQENQRLKQAERQQSTIALVVSLLLQYVGCRLGNKDKWSSIRLHNVEHQERNLELRRREKDLERQRVEASAEDDFQRYQMGRLSFVRSTRKLWEGRKLMKACSKRLAMEAVFSGFARRFAKAPPPACKNPYTTSRTTVKITKSRMVRPRPGFFPGLEVGGRPQSNDDDRPISKGR